jgi:hypothetical protein
MGLYKINVQADKYYFAFFTRFEAIADNPNLYPAVVGTDNLAASMSGTNLEEIYKFIDEVK